MSKHFQNACAPYLHPSICMWKASICRCQDFTKGQTEPKPWDSNISEGLRKLVFMALVYVIVGDKQVRWFSAEINSSRVGVCFGFGHFCQMALSDCLAWLLKPHTLTFCSHLKWSLLDQDALVYQRAVLHNHSGVLSSMIRHAQDWHGSQKIMPGETGKEWEGCFWCHSGCCTAEFTRWAYTGSPEAGQISPVGMVLPEQFRMPWLVDLHAPTSG